MTQILDQYDEIELELVHMLQLFQQHLALDLSSNEKIASQKELPYRYRLHNKIV